MASTSSTLCLTTRHPGRVQARTVCSSAQQRAARERVIRRFGLRQPAEGIPTEVQIKDPEFKEVQQPPADKRAPAPSKRTGAAAASTASIDIPSTSSGTRKGLVENSLDGISVLAGNLLMNAASWRVVRGQTYCVHCRGTGKETCPTCQGAGIVQPEKVRMNQIRHAAGKIQVLLGVNDAKMHDSDWLKSNRCKRCHGTGALPCKHCEGTGMLGPNGAR